MKHNIFEIEKINRQIQDINPTRPKWLFVTHFIVAGNETKDP